MAKKKLTSQQIKKRNEIADAIKRDNPSISDASKFKQATAAVRKIKK